MWRVVGALEEKQLANTSERQGGAFPCARKRPKGRRKVVHGVLAAERRSPGAEVHTIGRLFQSDLEEWRDKKDVLKRERNALWSRDPATVHLCPLQSSTRQTDKHKSKTSKYLEGNSQQPLIPFIVTVTLPSFFTNADLFAISSTSFAQ